MNFFLSNYEAQQLNQQFNENFVTFKRSATIFSSSINTSQIDQYRQGIEITTQKHYDLGTFKVHAGEVGHILRREYLSDDPIFRQEQLTFTEIDTFNPVEYINVQDNIDQYYIYTQNHTWPIVTKDSSLSLLNDLNGIVEIFDIRDIINFKHLPFHDVNGAIDFGSFNKSLGSSDIVSKEYFVHNQNPAFFDSSENNELNNIPAINCCITNTMPFIDQKIIKDIPSSLSTDNEILLVLSQTILSSSYQTCNSYIEYNQISATTGFIYGDVQGIGTDSLAFGEYTF